MNDDDKRTIKGVKDVKNKRFTGKIISKVIKVITAAVLSIGLAITAQQALKMYKQWTATNSLNNLSAIVNRVQDQSDQIMLDNDSLEGFETIMQEYKQAMEGNDKNRKKELDAMVEHNGYFDIIHKEIKSSIVKNLGYDPNEVEVIMGADGFYIADKSKMEEGVYIASDGSVSDRVKIKDEEGNDVRIPSESLEILKNATNTLSSSAFNKGVYNTSILYDKLISLNEPEDPVIEIAEEEQR